MNWFRRVMAAMLAMSVLTVSGCANTRKEDREPDVPDVADMPESEPEETSEDSAGEKDVGGESAVGEELIEGPAPELPAGELALPADNRQFKIGIARQVLSLCSGHTAENDRSLLEEAGCEVLVQNNFDKAADDPAHTCAYTIGAKTVEYNGAERTLLLVAIRGTNAGEWYSNFDIAESQSDDAVFAENFLFTAEDVLLGLTEVLKTQRAPLVLVCGHSRGAACANLLALLLNAQIGADNVIAYTFATPNTFRGEDPGVDCSNIFNLINPGDIVTKMPLEGWGYHRLGTDVLLPGEADAEKKVNEAAGTMLELAPTISQYYGERHSLTEAGLSDDGVTAFEMMLIFARSLAGTGTDTQSVGFGEVSEESDFALPFRLLDEAMKEGGEGAAGAAGQHMPAKYQKLMAEYGE